MITYHSTDAQGLERIARTLRSRGFFVGAVVIPENEYTQGPPYITTNATAHAIYLANRDTRGTSDA